MDALPWQAVCIESKEFTLSTTPLVVDLDGTLLRSDLLLETGLCFFRHRPLQWHKPLGWLSRGKAILKEKLALASDIEVGSLPYDPQVIALIEAERRNGRPVVLATASHQSLAERVAGHLQLFDRVLATSAGHNLSAHRKRDLLVAQYGEGGFDYIGNSRDDLPVWAAARKAYVVNPERGVEGRARALGNVEQVIRSNPASLRDWRKALRLHQWTKNLLVFAGVIFGQKLLDRASFITSVEAFAVFCLLSSAVYLVNDVRDREADRLHPVKSQRPIASGALGVGTAIIAAAVLAGGALVAAATINAPFAFVASAYLLLMWWYSWSIKHVVILDVLALAGGFVLRAAGGAVAVEVTFSHWLLLLTLLLATQTGDPMLRGTDPWDPYDHVGPSIIAGVRPEDMSAVAKAASRAISR